MKIIDIYSRIGKGRPEESRPVDVALHEMDKAGISHAWICPTDAYVAVRNHEGNDFIAKTISDYPDRFIGYAVANPWFGHKAIEELHRAFKNGLRGLFLYPPVQGFQLSDPLIDPLIEVAYKFNVPIYAHTGTPVCAMPFQLAALARRHQDVKFIMGHMGYSDFWYDAVAATSTSNNIWLETSLIDGDIIADGVKKLGAERFLFGSAAPFSIITCEIEKITSLAVSKNTIEKILQHNAKGLL
ncbi:amidohydrolase family protein [bacterium]|nr:amidohydrolase family protein [bacterium]